MTRPRRALPRSAAATLRTWQATIASHPLLTAAEECELATRAKAGDRAARDRMICANGRLVLRVVPSYLPRYGRSDYGLSAEDIIQEGMIGLGAAVDRFDPARGCRFSTMAMPWIHQAIMRAISSSPLIRITADGRKQAASSGQAAPAVVASTDERRDGNHADPGDTPWRNPHMDPADPAPLPDAVTIAGEHRAIVAEALAKLPRRMRYIVRARFGFWPSREPQTLESIGKRLGLTRERVRQIEAEALGRLRDIVPR